MPTGSGWFRLTLLVILTGCPGPGSPKCGEMADELPRLEGKTEAELVAELGEPHERRSFAMRDCCGEFQVELLNTYPHGEGHDDVEIHQWTWDYWGYSLTVWTHLVGDQWRALDTCRYEDGVEF